MTVETTEVTQDEEMASIQAGYDGARGDTPPAESDEAIEADASSAPEAVNPVVEETGSDGLTDSQRKTLMAGIPDLIQFKKETADTIRKLHGTIGELKGTIKQMQPAEAPARKFQADGLKRLHAEYPELAEALAEDLSGISLGGESKSSDGNADAVSEFARKLEVERLEAIVDEHPDFYTVKEAPEFKLWLATQNAEYQERLKSSQNPVFVAKGISLFKNHRDESIKRSKSKEKRLEGAITPNGVPGTTSSTLSDDAGVMVGYSRRKRS